MRFTTTMATGAMMAVASAADQNFLGFNSGATKADRSIKVKADFKAEFETAANLKGAPGDFNSVRLYTNIQGDTVDDPIEAFDAAVETNTNILLGVWASGTDNIDKELSALKKAVDKYGKKFTDLVIGITIGSEDLYRTSETGLKNDPDGVGNSPNAIVGFINDFKDAFKGSPLAQIPVGHADTWDVWGNATNKAVIDAIDFIAVHEYPYYESGKGNHIDNAAKLFQRAYDATIAAANGKPVWVTETGWPYVGPDWDEAEASTENAKTYWDEVGCKKLFNKTPTFWYTLRDSNPENTMKFGITDNLSTTPRFDISCDNVDDDEDEDDKPSSRSASHSASHSGTASASPTRSGTASASATPTSGNGNNGGSNGGSNGGNGGSPTGSEGGASPSQSGDPPAAAAGIQLFSAYTYAALAVVGGAFAMF